MSRPIDVRERLPKAEETNQGFVRGFYPATQAWVPAKASSLKENGFQYWMPVKE